MNVPFRNCGFLAVLPFDVFFVLRDMCGARSCSLHCHHPLATRSPRVDPAATGATMEDRETLTPARKGS